LIGYDMADEYNYESENKDEAEIPECLDTIVQSTAELISYI
jgi:hypothetical protein